jgi:effector-binding domain-containing protein
MKKNRRVYLNSFFIILLLLFFSQSFSGHGLKAQVGGEIKVEIKEVEPFVYCSLPRQGSFAEVEAAVGELLQHMQAQNVFPTGSMVGIFHSDPTMSDPEKIQWEVGFPINEQTIVQPPLSKKIWSFKTVAVAVHVGPYDKTGETILKMREWLEANGYVQNGPVLERYLDSDSGNVSPDKLRTEIWLPCKKV